MPPTKSPPPLQAGLAFAAFLAVGVIVWGVVSLLTGDLNLGFLYGLLPGLALGALAFVRLRRGGLFKRERTQDNQGREEA
ncbi:MAG: hypothetical protein ACLFQ5_08280 [Oceanicaulis sp.]